MSTRIVFVERSLPRNSPFAAALEGMIESDSEPVLSAVNGDLRLLVEAWREAVDWCFENFDERRFAVRERDEMIFFRDATDAAAFKIRWG